MRDGKKRLRSAGKTFPWPWLTAHSDGYRHLLLPSPHLDRQKVDPSLKHSDGRNCCNWELVTPHQNKTQQNPRDKICLKILTPPHFFLPIPSKKLWPAVLSSSAIKNPTSEKGQRKSKASYSYCWTTAFPPLRSGYRRCIKKKITAATRLHLKIAHAHPQLCVHGNTEQF